jgi:hypothetical protein
MRHNATISIKSREINISILNYWFKEKVSYIYTFNYHCGQTIFFVTIEYNKTLYNYPLWILLIDNVYRFVFCIFTYNYPPWSLLISNVYRDAFLLGNDHLTWFQIHLRDRPFNLQGWGGGMVFCFVQNFFSDDTRLRIFIYFVARIFFPEFNIRLYVKNSESD